MTLFSCRMNRICRYFATTVRYRDRSFRYIPPETQKKRDKEKMEHFKLRKGFPGAMPKSYHRKMRHAQADQSHWDRMPAEQRRKIREDDESPHGKMIKNIDEWKKKKRSNIYQPKPLISIPGTGGQTLISCSGSGDSEDYSLLQNQRYQTFDSINLYFSKFKGEPGKGVRTGTAARNRKLRRPEMQICAVEGNSSLTDVSFADLGINPRLCDALLKLYGIRFASKIQVEIISHFFNSNSDIIGISETGSGKTFSYLIPVLHAYLEDGATSLITTTQGILKEQIYTAARDLLLQMDYVYPPDVIGAGAKLNVTPISISTIFDKVCDFFHINTK